MMPHGGSTRAFNGSSARMISPLPGLTAREVSAFCVRVELEQQATGLIALHDVTDSRRAEREARTLARITSSLTLKTSVYQIAETITEWVVETTEGVASAVFLFSGDTRRHRMVGSFGLPPTLMHPTANVLPENSKLARHLLAEPHPVLVRDLQKYCRDDPASESLGPLFEELSWTSLVSVPLLYRGRHVGVLLTFYPTTYEPDDNDVEFLQALADQSVFALENARLFSDAQDKAALEERQRLARELHDSVSQALYGIALGTRSARSQLEQHPDRVAERLDYVLKLAEAAITEMRALIFELRPESLATEGLVVALSKQAAALRARHHLEVEAQLGDEPELSLQAKEALYRIAQEALHNIVKHARAGLVTLTLEPAEDQVVLLVADDGMGFDPQGEFPGHLGLSSMRERAELLGGTFQICSATGEGTQVRVTLPYD